MYRLRYKNCTCLFRYLLAHQDTYIFAHNLACHLSNMVDGLVLTGQMHCFGVDFKCASGGIIFKKHHERSNPQGWMNGGAGIAVSGAMAKAMDLSHCIEYYSKTWRYRQAAPDVVFTCCGQDSGAERIHSPVCCL